MILSPHKRMTVLRKTNFKCAVCGSAEDLDCGCFIPDWTRVPAYDADNLIPLCPTCWTKNYGKFIEIGKLKHLPELHVQQAMRYYKSVDKFLYKYVLLYGKRRSKVDISISETLLILESYNQWIREHSEDLDWESL